MLAAPPTHAQASGRVVGTVSQSATGTFLKGATVEILPTGRSVVTDDLGHFAVTGLAPGSYTLQISYVGLDAERREARVEAAGTARVDVALKSEVYRLDSFEVTAEKSGQAAAITRQRNASNLVNVAATDAFGSLANQNPGEIFMRLPGVAATIGEDNEASAVSIRGMASNLNAVAMDGGMLAPVSSGATRQVRFTTNVTAQFEEFEVVKGLTPDMDASSIGGTLNMKTRSPLSSTRENEFNYRIGARWAPSFVPHNPLRRERPLHSDLSVGYQGVFDIADGKRNLGVAFNATYFESVGDYIRSILDYQSTNATPSYRWDYHASDYYFNRQLATVAGRIDYQLSEATRLSLRGTVNDYTAFGGHLYNETRIFTGQTVATLDASGNPTGTGAILPNFTATRTEARAIAASQLQMIVNSVGQLQRQRTVQFVTEHKRGPLQLDTDFNLATGILDQSGGQDTKDKTGGTFTSTITGVGWILDSSRNREFPRFTQMGGPNVYDINNYRNSILTQAGSRRGAHIYAGKADARYELPTDAAAFLKAGVAFRRQDSIATTWNTTRSTYAGPDRVLGNADDTLGPFRDTNLQRSPEFGLGNLPFIHVGLLAQNLKDHPEQWVEDVYFRESQKYAGTNTVTEDVSAAYLMGSLKRGKLTVLGGARVERTEVESEGWVLQRSLPTITDPVVRAATEYGFRSRSGSYTNTMPSVHFTYAIQPRLLARASYSTGIARPQFSSLIPSETVNDTARTVTISNPGLEPQTADNWDLSLEYYMKQLGLASVSVFEKDLHDFQFSTTGGIVGTGNDNGFNGQYAGYTISTQLNGGNARVRGIELNYQQQFNLGPAWLRKFGIFGNYTRLNTRGNYGAAGAQSVTALAEFVPTTWNAGLRFAHGRFRSNLLVNYTGEYLFAYSTSAPRLQYKQALTITTLSANYNLGKGLDLYCDAYNLFNVPQRYYRGIPGRLQQYTLKGMILSFGVRGRF